MINRLMFDDHSRKGEFMMSQANNQGMPTPIITKSGAVRHVIPRKRDLHKLRVCAYCRVSTMQENQEESFETQQEYYRRLIGFHPDWEFAGIYADRRSGLDAKHRDGFQQMIKDALDGKVDYILCKSVSRFSRNLLDAQTYCELLAGNGVYCEFERDNIKTKNPSYTMSFSMLATIAQQESKAISERTRWAIRKRMERGEYSLGNRVFGYKTVDGKLVPDEDAPTVRTMYQMFADGHTFQEIRDYLAGEGILTRNGNPVATATVQYTLQNEIYKGDRLLGKRAPRDYLTKESIAGEYYSNYLEGDHEAIVDKELWDAVQAKLKEREAWIRKAGPTSGKRAHPLYGKIICGRCGGLMSRNTHTGYNGEKHKVWICKDRLKGRRGNGCRGRIVREDEVLEVMNTGSTADNLQNTVIKILDDGIEVCAEVDPESTAEPAD